MSNFLLHWINSCYNEIQNFSLKKFKSDYFLDKNPKKYKHDVFCIKLTLLCGLHVWCQNIHVWYFCVICYNTASFMKWPCRVLLFKLTFIYFFRRQLFIKIFANQFLYSIQKYKIGETIVNVYQYTISIHSHSCKV